MSTTIGRAGRTHPFEGLLAFSAALLGRRAAPAAMGHREPSARGREEAEPERLPRHLRDEIGIETYGPDGVDARLLEMAMRMSGYWS